MSPWKMVFLIFRFAVFFFMILSFRLHDAESAGVWRYYGFWS
jgi:hypothetical protein